MNLFIREVGMKTQKFLEMEKGFTLIGVVLLLLAIGIIAVIAGVLGVKLQFIAKERNTVNRMIVIRDASKDYYRGHRNLPDPAGTNVPVQDLDVEQKYRVDAWGQYFYYNRITKTVDGISPATITITATNIIGLSVNGKQVAGVIISGGANQTIEPSTISGTTFTKTGDDIVVPINVQAEAIEIANNELHIMAKKACAYRCGHPDWPDFIYNEVDVGKAIIQTFSLGNVFVYDPWLTPYLWEKPNIRVRTYGPDLTALSPDDLYVIAGGLPCCPGAGVPEP
ncbi:MAG: type II secretion system protein, partial [Pseudomonadota bacterium]